MNKEQIRRTFFALLLKEINEWGEEQIQPWPYSHKLRLAIANLYDILNKDPSKINEGSEDNLIIWMNLHNSTIMMEAPSLWIKLALLIYFGFLKNEKSKIQLLEEDIPEEIEDDEDEDAGVKKPNAEIDAIDNVLMKLYHKSHPFIPPRGHHPLKAERGGKHFRHFHHHH